MKKIEVCLWLLSVVIKVNEIKNIKKKDDQVLNEIMGYLDLEKPKSFFMLAGAGSGKTRTLVEVLQNIDIKYGDELNLLGRKVAVITYTNAACDEIISRLKHNDLFSVSTIHSFAWQMINTFQKDIKTYVKDELIEKINELQEKQNKAKSISSKSYIGRKMKLENHLRKLQNLNLIKYFTYSPDGDNSSKNSLNHTQVIKIFSRFLKQPLMQKIIIRNYPIILIDECQDTNKFVVDSFVSLQEENSNKISIGFFGDVMQRIYSNGKQNLNSVLEQWEQPTKHMNYRCPKRIVKILNRLRSDVDGLKQYSDDEKIEGYVRVYICQNNLDKVENEKRIRRLMKEVTDDEKWEDSVEALILEHHMAATRLGFEELFLTFSESSKFKSKLTDGTLVETKFFNDQIFPMVEAYGQGEEYKVAQLAKRYFTQFNEDIDSLTYEKIQDVRQSVKRISEAFEEKRSLTGVKLLKIIRERNDLILPERIKITLDLLENQEFVNQKYNENNGESKEIEVLEKILNLDLSQTQNYSKYMNQEAGFSTHQGVKGLEYPRVMLIISDDESRGFMFSYEKLFNIKEKTATDINNEQNGQETAIDRTKRLFYVGCSRAEKSLAIVIYVDDPVDAREKIIDSGWFEDKEVVVISEE